MLNIVVITLGDIIGLIGLGLVLLIGLIYIICLFIQAFIENRRKNKKR